MQSIPKRVRGFFYSGATTGKPSLRVRELFSTHDGCYATRSIFFFFLFSQRRMLRNRSLFFRTEAYNATRRILFVLFHDTFPFSPDAGILGKGGVLWRAP
jgi:hypothetical protein